MKTALVLFRRDPYGIKKGIYKLVDTFTPRNVYRFEAISYHYPLEDKHNYLNRNHELWRNPTTYDMTSNESFVDLYLKSIKLAKVLVCASLDYLNNNDIDVEEAFAMKKNIDDYQYEVAKILSLSEKITFPRNVLRRSFRFSWIKAGFKRRLCFFSKESLAFSRLCRKLSLEMGFRR